MRGMMQKDLCLLLQRSRVLVVLVGIAVLMAFSTDGSFVIGYLTMLCAILTIGTISYDEYDNGYPFLLTLPITRKTYVNGKYLFCVLGGLAGWCISVVIFIGCSLVKGNAFSLSDLPETLAFIPVLGLIIAIMLPLQLKYGAEKSRVVIMLIGGGGWALGYFGMKLLPDTQQLSAMAANISDRTIIVVLIAICLAAFAASYLISLHIMEKKEF